MNPKKALYLVVILSLVAVIGAQFPLAGEPGVSPWVRFMRGDCDGDGQINITDPIVSLKFLFLGGEAPLCLDTADANDDGAIDLTDPIVTLMHLFSGGSVPSYQFGYCSVDITPDEISCEDYTACD